MYIIIYIPLFYRSIKIWTRYRSTSYFLLCMHSTYGTAYISYVFDKNEICKASKLRTHASTSIPSGAFIYWAYLCRTKLTVICACGLIEEFATKPPTSQHHHHVTSTPPHQRGHIRPSGQIKNEKKKKTWKSWRLWMGWLFCHHVCACHSCH